MSLYTGWVNFLSTDSAILSYYRWYKPFHKQPNPAEMSWTVDRIDGPPGPNPTINIFKEWDLRLEPGSSNGKPKHYHAVNDGQVKSPYHILDILYPTVVNFRAHHRLVNTHGEVNRKLKEWSSTMSKRYWKLWMMGNSKFADWSCLSRTHSSKTLLIRLPRSYFLNLVISSNLHNILDK